MSFDFQAGYAEFKRTALTRGERGHLPVKGSYSQQNTNACGNLLNTQRARQTGKRRNASTRAAAFFKVKVPIKYRMSGPAGGN